MEKQFKLRDNEEAKALFGRHDEHLRVIEKEFRISLFSREGELILSGEEEVVQKAAKLIDTLLIVLRKGGVLKMHDVLYSLKTIKENRQVDLAGIYLDRIEVFSKRQFVTPRTAGQKRYVDAIRNYDIVFGIGPAGTGKCVAGSTLVLTNQGLLPIETLGAGTDPGTYSSIALDISGRNGTEKASHLYNGGRSQTKRIRTRLGFEIEVTPEHPLLKMDACGQTSWTPAESLQIGDYVAIQRGQRLFGQETSITFQYRPNGPQDHAKPIHIDQLDEALAYFMGILTGDGCLTFKNRIIISSADPEILQSFKNVADQFGLHVFPNGGNRPYDRIIASSQLYQLLLHLGMSRGPAKTKRIPRAILKAPESFVIAFLQGLFDTDGTVSRRDGVVQVSSVSKQLMDEVQVVLLNFGILANKRQKRTWYRDTQRLSYYLEITGRDVDRFYETIGFRLKRKQSLRLLLARNTNIDVIPHIHQVIHTAISVTVFPRTVHKAFGDYKTGRRKPSYETLGKVVTLLEQNSWKTKASLTLETLHAQNFFWAEIREIEEGEADVYDLTVPGSHSFCANGFVNHNTYLAMAMAVEALQRQKVGRIILTRPAVEAGERLGFLPGDMQEKVSPYLRPLYDALYDMMEVDRIERYVERGIIEVAPLAFMRGRTLNDSFIILDEAQNATQEQMKMFLTRLGFDSKTVITGDVTQVDLPSEKPSGLVQVQTLLKHIEGLAFVQFTGQDVVRHELVQQIIEAYERSGGKVSGKGS